MKTRRQRIKSTYTAIAAFTVAILFILFSIIGVGTRLTASADVAGPAKFESQNVLDDLKNSVIGDKAFNMADYPADENGEIKILSFIEYCYACDAARMGYYGLYLYVYNPQQTIFDFAKGRNTLQMRVGGGSGEDYEKYPLEYLNCNVDSVDNVGLYYKFKIALTANQRTEILNKLDPENRVYEISGIELMTYGGYTAADYPSYGHDQDGKPIGNKYNFSGFSAGYGTTTESTLSCTVDLCTNVELDVQHTFYRTKTSNKGAGYQVQLDTVYFSVPKALIENYGKLQRIKAEWWEYKTQPIIVVDTSNSTAKGFYDYAEKHIGQKMETGMTEFDAGLDNTFGIGEKVSSAGLLSPGVMLEPSSTGYGWHLSNTSATLYYLFDTNGIPISNYDPYADITANGGITSNRLYDYIKSFGQSGFEVGEIVEENGEVTTGASNPSIFSKKYQIKNGQIAACLFQDDIDVSRKVENEYGKIQQGYSYYDFDIDTDMQEIKTYKHNNYFTDFDRNAKVLGFWKALIGYYSEPEGWTKTLPPIQILADDDIKGESESERQKISDALCVNYNDVKALQAFYSAAQENDEEVVLLRFATSDYYAGSTDIVRYERTTVNFIPATVGRAYKGLSYVATQSVFFDFDVIQLAFSKNGAVTVMATVSSPIDIVNPITPPYVPPVNDWWKYALGIVGGLIAVWIGTTVIKKIRGASV